MSNNNWILKEINLHQITFIPKWKEVDDSGNETGKYKSIVGEWAINIYDLPDDLILSISDIVKSAIDDI